MNTFKKLFLYVLASGSFLVSCSKSEELVSPSNVTKGGSTAAPVEINVYRCEPYDTRTLLAGQHINAGTVSLSSDASGNIWVTYTTTGGWTLQSVQFHIGATLADIPRNPVGNLVPGHFAFQFHNLTGTTHEFMIPASAVPANGCYAMAAKANVTNNNGVSSETAFAQGTQTGKNWFMYFAGCRQTCTPPDMTGCSYSQGFWFASPVSTSDWAIRGGSVTVGGYTYTEAEARAIFRVNGGNWAKRLFCQVATVTLSLPTIHIDRPYASDLKAWYTSGQSILGGIGYKLTPQNLPNSNNTQAGALAGNIGDWIDRNHCE